MGKKRQESELLYRGTYLTTTFVGVFLCIYKCFHLHWLVLVLQFSFIYEEEVNTVSLYYQSCLKNQNQVPLHKIWIFGIISASDHFVMFPVATSGCLIFNALGSHSSADVVSLSSEYCRWVCWSWGTFSCFLTVSEISVDERSHSERVTASPSAPKWSKPTLLPHTLERSWKDKLKKSSRHSSEEGSPAWGRSAWCRLINANEPKTEMKRRLTCLSVVFLRDLSTLISSPLSVFWASLFFMSL